MQKRTLWQKIRRVWAVLGTLAFVVFAGWSLLAYRASATARAALESDAAVEVTAQETHWTFTPMGGAHETGLVFFPGALVDPVAYAPFARDVASAGYPVALVRVPRRGAFGGADGPEVLARARAAMQGRPGVTRWVTGGHSRGGVIASAFVRQDAARLAGLVLIGTSHPRDFSLAQLTVPVAKIYGTRDTIADVEKIDATRSNLPPHTTWVRIDGGNHSQFGWYGFQPGDWPATITRQRQHVLTVAAVIALLEQAGR